MCVNHPRFARLYAWGQNYVEHVVGHIRKQQNMQASGRTLIVGAGTGLDVPVLGPKVTEVVLLEPDPNMRRVLHEVYPSLRVLASTAEHIDVEEQRYDTVISSLVLCSVADVHQVLLEIYRVLKPGGQYLFMEHVKHSLPFPQFVQNTLNPVWKHLAGGCHLNRDIHRFLACSKLDVLECRLTQPNFLIPIITGRAVRAIR